MDILSKKELSAKIRDRITGEMRAVTFVAEANTAANDYIALTDIGRPKWNEYNNRTGEYLNTIARYLKVEQIKPLLFAIARYFLPSEADKAFRYAVSISVRFLIYGGRGGFLDEHYAARAHDIGSGKITRARELRELREAMREAVPSDAAFAAAFATAKISKGYLARYILRAIDKTLRDDPDAEFVANEDYDATNFEHIIPVNPGSNWTISQEDASIAQNMIGNLTLLAAKKNVKIGNSSFTEKKTAYRESGYKITSDLENFQDDFGLPEVRKRQSELAEAAVETRPLTFE
jgi:hypothetical protein